MIAALLISGAAVCALAQSGPQRKENRRQNEPIMSTPDGRESREGLIDEQSGTDKPATSRQPPNAQSKNVQYSYEFKQDAFIINHVLIEHDWDGSGKITFERKNSDPIVDPIELSQTTIERLRLLWDALHFFDTDRSYQTPKQYPHLGTIRIRMKQDPRERVAEFNWTADKDAFALVTEYKRIANQAIFIFDITLARENQPLDAPKLMDQLDAYVRRNEIADAKQLIPLLRGLTTDERIPLMARNSAARTLKKIDK